MHLTFTTRDWTKYMQFKSKQGHAMKINYANTKMNL